MSARGTGGFRFFVDNGAVSRPEQERAVGLEAFAIQNHDEINGGKHRKMEKSRIQDLVIGIVCAAVGIWAWIISLQFPATTQMYTHVALGAFIGLSAILIVWSVIHAKVPGGEVVQPAIFKNPMLTFVMILVYVLLLDKIGFFVASAVFMLGFMWFMGYRKPLTMILTTVGMLGFIYLLFVYELHVSLPEGILF